MLIRNLYLPVSILLFSIACQPQLESKLAINSETKPISFEVLQKYEKAAQVLTGSPLSDEQRLGLINGSMTEDTLHDELLSSQNFQIETAKYWSQVLGINARQEWSQLSNRDGRRLAQVLQGPVVDLRFGNTEPNKDALDRMQNQISSQGRKRLTIRKCEQQSVVVFPVIDKTNRDRLSKIVSQSKYWNDQNLSQDLNKYKELNRLVNLVEPECGSDEFTAVNPFWSPESNYLVSKVLLDDKYCGDKLLKCWIPDRAEVRYMAFADTDATLEPGLIIGKTIAEDLPIGNILTTTKTVVSENLAHFYRNNMLFWDNFPGGMFIEANESRWIEPEFSPGQRDYFWIDRTEEHTGVLSTFAFHMVTNGRRAKANRIYEGFLCSKFAVDADIHPDPSDDNPDLTQRTYCSACHKTLEPFANFFSNWPEAGNVNYLFNPSADVDSSGQIFGQKGNGIKEMAQVISQSDEFASCTIKRTFAMIYGRDMTKSEEVLNLPNFIDTLKESEMRIKPVIKQMLKSPEFSAVRK